MQIKSIKYILVVITISILCSCSPTERTQHLQNPLADLVVKNTITVHNKTPKGAIFSNGTMIAIHDSNHVYLYDKNTFTLLHKIVNKKTSENQISISEVFFSPSTDILFVSYYNSRLYNYSIELIELDTYKAVKTFSKHTSSDKFRFIPNSNSFVIEKENKISVWHFNAGSFSQDSIHFSGSLLDDHSTFSPNGKLLVTTNESSFKIWNVNNGELLHNFSDGDGGSEKPIYFSPDGELLITRNDFGLNLRNINNGRLLHNFPNASLPIAINESGTILVTSEVRHDYTTDENITQVNLWRIDSGKHLISLDKDRNSFYYTVYDDPIDIRQEIFF